jgi:hypothetical protein
MRIRNRARDHEGRGRGGSADHHRLDGAAERRRSREVSLDPTEEPERHERDDHRYEQCSGMLANAM